MCMRDTDFSLGGGLGNICLSSDKLLQVDMGLCDFQSQNTDKQLFIFAFVSVRKVVFKFHTKDNITKLK